jgi:hypothetical protein
VRSVRLYLALHAACLGVILLPGALWASASTTGAIGEMPLPGGLRAALAVLNDPVAPDRGQFLVEIIRRTYATPIAVRNDPRDVALRALLAHLDRAQDATGSAAETVPLPLTPTIWTEVIFGGRVRLDALASAILESRSASLFYYALLSVDGPTREWIGSQRALIQDLAGRNAAAFAVAAPGFRVSEGRVRVPGGERAEPAWEAVVGRRVTEPAEFLRALLTADEGRTGYFLTAMSELTSAQATFAMGSDPSAGAAALHRLHAVFDHVTPGWKTNDRTLWRPRRDPALLLSDLALDGQGRPTLPGSRAFWVAAFSSDDVDAQRTRAAELAGEPDFAWLCEQVFSGTPAEQRRRYDAVLFASRVVKRVEPETALEALDAVRSAWMYPALNAVLERARSRGVAVYANAAHRAARLSTIPRAESRIRAISQFQGTIGLLARMVSRGSLAPAAFERAVTSLSALECNRQGEYDGAVVRWFAEWVRTIQPHAKVDDALMQLLAGPPPSPARFVEWEGTRYKIDLAAAEGGRLFRLLGEESQARLAAAEATKGSAADEAWANAVTVLSYAIALGQPEHSAVSVADLARRHDFGLRAETGRTSGPWMIPVAEVSPRGYRITGALLGLDVALADFSLTRVSSRAPPRKPSISSEERAIFIATVPLVEPVRLADEDADRIVTAMDAARVRVASTKTGSEATALVASIPIAPIRRSVFPWIVSHDPSRAASFFSPVELLWLGLGDAPVSTSMQGWGVSGQARVGCLCLQVIDRRSGDMLTGRVNAGILASGFPDLELRLAALLAELKMPASLLGGVLASATFDFVNGATSRDEDDRRGLVEFVQALRVDRVEEYLAMLTTGGPLVPPRDDADR